MKIGPPDPEILRLRANQSATTQNWLPWQRPLRNWKNWTWSRKLTQIPSIWWKVRENRSSRYWDNFTHSKKIKKTKKKLTQAKYIARSAGLPIGLKDIQNHYHQSLIVRSLKCIKSAARLTTYLLGSEHPVHVLYMHAFLARSANLPKGYLFYLR